MWGTELPGLQADRGHLGAVSDCLQSAAPEKVLAMRPGPSAVRVIVSRGRGAADFRNQPGMLPQWSASFWRMRVGKIARHDDEESLCPD